MLAIARAPNIAEEHDTLTVPAVDQRADRQAEEDVGQRL
jgi:hypothetical protein